MRLSAVTTAACLAFIAAGCATVSRDAGLADVQREVGLRTPQPIEVQTAASNVDDERLKAMLNGEIDADRVVAIAVVNNPRVQAALAGLGVARADLLEASTIRNPIFGAELRFPSSPSLPYDLSLTQSLIDLIQLRRKKAAGQLAFQGAQFRVASEILALAADARADYYDLVSATQRLTIDRTAVEAARAAGELAMRQHDAGNITDLDLENEQAAYEQAKVDLARSEEDLLVGREAMIRDMGLRNAATDWKIRADFPPLPAAEPTDQSVQQLLSTRRLDIAAAQREVDAAQRLLPGARLSTSAADLAAGVHREHDAEGKTNTGPVVEIPIPIFNRGAAARARAKAQLLRSQQQLASLMASAGSEARSARQVLLAARGRVDYYRDVVLPRRKRIVDLTQLEQNAMIAGLYQLLQAKQNELNARRDYVGAQRDYWLARTELDRALSGIEPAQHRLSMPAERRGTR